MYWACFNTTTEMRAVIYSANDPMENGDTRWDATYPYDNRDDAIACIDS